MPASRTGGYQKLCARKLAVVFGKAKYEWPSMAGEGRIYSPRVDIAVGPFADNERLIEEYDSLMDSNRAFFKSLLDSHLQNIRLLDNGAPPLPFDTLKSKNLNARCLMAIEIENRVSRKHLMGGIVNATALGRVGIVIAWNDSTFRASLRIRDYLRFLKSVGKNTFDTTNLLILKRGQFQECLSHY